MATYRSAWRGICLSLGMIGTAVALTVSPAAAAFLFVVSGAVGSLLTMCLVSEYWEQGATGRVRLLAIGAGAVGTTVGAFVGYASLVGPAVLLLVAAVLAGSPYAVKVSRGWLRSVRAPSSAQLDAVARALAYANPDYVQFRQPELRELSDEQLCWRWRASCEASRRRPSTVQLISISAERQACLDELERRNAKGFAAWLSSAPQIKDPLPYITGDASPLSTLDWDELTRGTG